MPTNTSCTHTTYNMAVAPAFPETSNNKKTSQPSGEKTYRKTKKNTRTPPDQKASSLWIMTFRPPRKAWIHQSKSQALLPALGTFRCSHQGLEHRCTDAAFFYRKMFQATKYLLCIPPKYLQWIYNHMRNICSDNHMWSFRWQFAWSRMCCPQICPANWLETAMTSMHLPSHPNLHGWCVCRWRLVRSEVKLQPFVPCVWTSWRACSHWAKPCEVCIRTTISNEQL